jgi:hypothetical protein
MAFDFIFADNAFGFKITFFAQSSPFPAFSTLPRPFLFGNIMTASYSPLFTRRITYAPHANILPNGTRNKTKMCMILK